MSYTAKNIQIFTSAYAGALAGMGLSDRVINNTDPAAYAALASVAGAFAQAVDTAWTAARATTLLDTEAVQSNAAAYWQDRSPNADATTLDPGSHAVAALALVATITASESYFTAQGLTPPAIPGGSSGGGGFPNTPDLTTLGSINWILNGLANGYQYYVHTQRSFWILSQAGTETVDGNTVIAATGGGRWIRNLSFAHPTWLNVGNWYINALTGNDENDGQAATQTGTRIGPLKSHGELERRWNSGTITPPNPPAVTNKFICYVHILSDLPDTDPVNITVKIAGATILWYQGTVASVLYTGTFSAVTTHAANQAWQVTDSGIGSWTTYLGQRIRITTVGATFNDCFYVLKDLGTNQARVSEPVIPSIFNGNPAFVNVVTKATPVVGNTFQVETLFTVSIGKISPVVTPSAASGKTGFSSLIFMEINVRKNPLMATSFSYAGASYATCMAFVLCNIPYTIPSSACQFVDCMLREGLELFEWHQVEFYAGGSGVGGLFNLGIQCDVPGVKIAYDFVIQGAGLRGSGYVVQSLGVYDCANDSFNNGGHGVRVGSGFVSGANITPNPMNAACGVWAISDTSTAIFGSGNAGAGMYIDAGSLMVYRPGTSPFTVTGTGGDLKLNGGTTANVWDQTALAGVGAYLAPRTTSWANLAASVATTGFGGNARDLQSGAGINQNAA